MAARTETHPQRRPWLDGLFVIGGAAGLTLLFFLVLPIMQAIARDRAPDTILVDMNRAQLPPPPPPPLDPEPEEEPEEKEPPPELEESVQPLDLSQLEMALNPSFGDGWMTGDFTMKLGSLATGAGDVEELFEMASLDQRPRPIHQANPIMTPQVREKAPGKAVVIFIVDEHGKVQSPSIQKSDDPVFERPALEAIRKWKFEPGKRNGEAVSSRTRITITFPKT